MTQPFKVESHHIERLDELQLTQLLKLLLHAEADKHGIAQRSVEVALNIKVADGGEDGRIEWQGGIKSTDYLPNRLTLFQNKAATMSPSDCAKELLTESGTIKPMVKQVVEQGGAYVLFTTQELNKQQKIQKRITKMREKLIELKLINADTVDIRIYDASQIAGWVNFFLSAIVSVLDWARQPIERGLKPFSEWKTTPEFNDYLFVEVDERKQVIADLRNLLKQPQQCARIVGLSGLGKTRIAFEIFKGNDFLQERVVYIDAANVFSVTALLSDWVGIGLKGIVVVDNCDAKIHGKIQEEVMRTNSQLSVLTLDYNLEKVSNTQEIQLKPFSTLEIKKMLENIYGTTIPDIERIAEFGLSGISRGTI